MNDEKSYNKEVVREKFLLISQEIVPDTLEFDHYDAWMNQVYAFSKVAKDFPTTGIDSEARLAIWQRLRIEFPRIGFCVLNNHTIYQEPVINSLQEEKDNDVKPIL
jgi:hypothetical protein